MNITPGSAGFSRITIATLLYLSWTAPGFARGGGGHGGHQNAPGPAPAPVAERPVIRAPQITNRPAIRPGPVQVRPTPQVQQIRPQLVIPNGQLRQHNFQSVQPGRVRPFDDRRPVVRGDRFEHGGRHADWDKDHFRDRLRGLEHDRVRYPRVVNYFYGLYEAGYDPVYLDSWMDDVEEDTVVPGMPAGLVLECFGEPEYRNEVFYGGDRAELWGVRVGSDRIQEVTVYDGRVVSVRG